MKRVTLLTVAWLALLSGCLSKEAVFETYLFRPELSELTAVDSLGTRPLRFDGIRFPVEIGNAMVWRISQTELSADEQNLWARRPPELIEERVRDLLFSVGGFRDAVLPGGPVLNVRVVTFEGDVSGPESLAVIELIVDLDDGNDVHHRTRLRVEKPTPSRDAQGLAGAMGPAISSVSERCVRWVSSKLGTH